MASNESVAAELRNLQAALRDPLAYESVRRIADDLKPLIARLEAPAVSQSDAREAFEKHWPTIARDWSVLTGHKREKEEHWLTWQAAQQVTSAPAEQRLRELTEDEVMSAINYWRGYNGTLAGATAMLNAALVKKYGERG